MGPDGGAKAGVSAGELTDHALGQIGACNPVLNAFVAVDEGGRARRQTP